MFIRNTVLGNVLSYQEIRNLEEHKSAEQILLCDIRGRNLSRLGILITYWKLVAAGCMGPSQGFIARIRDWRYGDYYELCNNYNETRTDFGSVYETNRKDSKKVRIKY
jgi:hypothetical protein